MAITPNGAFAGKAYVTNSDSDTVSVINTATNTVSATIPDGDFPDGVAITPDGTKAYVTNYSDGTVSVINTATNLVVGSPILVGIDPEGVAITPDGVYAYVTNSSSNNVSVIDTATNTVSATIPVGKPEEVAICPAAVVPPVTPTDPAVVLKFTG